ncbi:MAG: maleylpyruvate isomerase family mycothiol-dependent enzyme [Streptosporangiales bacterium]|nr:maleylpyruvate isomerase family mycothiol-dependent enzyme [Streptosporangiales bacterium]
MDASELRDLDPFDIFDAEAERLDRFFASLDGAEWDRPSRCAGWSVRDVLAHLAGEEAYNHACLDDDVQGLFNRLAAEGLTGGGLADFNEWCVRQRRDLPVGRVLEEWRAANAETRRRMRERGRGAELQTFVGQYPVGLQTFHYASEFATHADDVGVPVQRDEEPGRTRWRARFGRFALDEAGSSARVEPAGDGYRVRLDGTEAELPERDFVEATVDRLPADHPLGPTLREALRCLA